MRGVVSKVAMIGMVAAGTSLAGVQSKGTAFTYQGQLKNDGVSVTDMCAMDFGLWTDDASTDPLQQVATVSLAAVQVTNGLFTVDVDFGEGAITGRGRWLEIAVQCTGDIGPIQLAPRQALTPAPHAIALPGLWTRQGVGSPNLIGGYDGNQIELGIAGATIGGGGQIQRVNAVYDGYGTVAGGEGNQAGSDDGNGSTGNHATVVGGLSNVARERYSAVGGGHRNQAMASYATISGGGPSNPGNPVDTQNMVTDTYGTIGGGGGNVAGDGTGNGDDAPYATVAGGRNNTAGNIYSSVGGGDGNMASGWYSTVPGGSNNLAAGDTSFAAGNNATANHNGSFVWADSTGTPFASTGNDQFLIRASGGVGIGLTNPQVTLDVNGTVRATSFALGGPLTRHLSIPGVTFQPWEDAVSYQKNRFGGYLQGTVCGENVIFFAPVNLPDGATMTGFEADVLDNDDDLPANIFVSLESWMNDSVTTIGIANSTSLDPAVRTLSASFSEAVDNNTKTYYIVADWLVPESSIDNIRLYRVRVDYTLDSIFP